MWAGGWIVATRGIIFFHVIFKYVFLKENFEFWLKFYGTLFLRAQLAIGLNSCNGYNWPWLNILLIYVHMLQGRHWVNTLRPRQNGRRFADDTFKCIFLNENVHISIEISLKFVPKGPINNIPPLVQIMAWRRSGEKPLSEPMMASLLTHICVTRPQWVKSMFLPHSWSKCCKRQNLFSYLIICQSEPEQISQVGIQSYGKHEIDCFIRTHMIHAFQMFIIFFHAGSAQYRL